VPRDGASVNAGDLITLGCTALFAAHLTYMSVYAHRYDVRQLTVLQITVAAVLAVAVWLGVNAYTAIGGAGALPPMLAREAEPLVWSGRVLWQLGFLTLFATVANFLMWTWAQSRMSATHAAIIFSLEPVFATLFAVFARGAGEWTGGARATLGAVLILAGVAVSELRLGRERSSQ